MRVVVCCAGRGPNIRRGEAELLLISGVVTIVVGVVTIVVAVVTIVVAVASLVVGRASLCILLGDTRQLVARELEAGVTVAMVTVQFTVTTTRRIGGGVVIGATDAECGRDQQ
ncbi:hypothetical protein [Enhygromyxa salina]|uniref:hypothetical protein n=1 Tax=Enhygromyxa salina TaxID=215803 RepID=UPI0015E5D38B|nr:hypothetical protein [Enhygromyxa salina]